MYIKGDDFTNELIASIREGKNAEFREKYRQSTLLLVDDIQFIAGKKQTQEEFFHTFNTLYESGRQIVLTSDRPPREMTQLEDRLQTRFEWGLMVDVAPPDFETRLAIIKNKAALLGVQLPDDISSFIAENLTANVRQIEGALNKLLAYRDLLGNQVDGMTKNTPRDLGNFFFTVTRNKVKFDLVGDPNGMKILTQFPPPGVLVPREATITLRYTPA